MITIIKAENLILENVIMTNRKYFRESHQITYDLKKIQQLRIMNHLNRNN